MLVAVALALFGLLSMHGWGSHTGGHSMAMAPVGAPASGHVAIHEDHVAASDAGHAETGATNYDAFPQAGPDKNPDGDPGASLLGLCLAILCGVLLGIALLLIRRGIRTPRWLLPAWSHPVFVGRDRDPPDPLRLCVIRC